MHLLSCTIKSGFFPSNDCYPFIIPAIRFLNKLDFTSPVTIFAGDNGSGKSTLLRAITMRCNIHIWSGPEREKPGYNPYEDRLWEFLDITWAHGPVPGSFFGAEMFRQFAQNVDEWASLTPGVLDYYGGRPLTSQSHGQCHLSYFRNRYGIRGLYFLDEPENALAPAKELELMKLMHLMGRQGHAQFIMATHSPILMACPGAKIFSFDSTPVKEVLYEDTEHFRFYREFMNNREKFIDS
jgi:predicted ATPase